MFSWLKLGLSSLIYSFQKYFEPYKVSKMPLLFAFFSKKWKQSILFCNFLCEKSVDRKNGVHHDEQRGKTKKIAISDFLFSKLCHRDFLRNIFIDFHFFEKTQNRPFCFAFFSVKNASTEKMEYTTTISAEKGRR